MFADFVINLKLKLALPLPGAEVQFEMAHTQREKINALQTNDYRQSAVLLLLYPNSSNEPVVILIERFTYNGHHSGQIALPGGKSDPEDFDLKATALREFFEETGSDKRPEIIGKLTPVYIPVSKFAVHPYVAYLNKRPQFNMSEREVKEIIEWPLKELLLPNTLKQTRVEPAPGLKFKTPYFDVDGKVLWGATAMIINEFKWIISKI